jgi:tetratricopeptide (TPR) repeat protein
MKSEERHKLQQNELADLIAKWFQILKPYQNIIYGSLIVILVAGLLLVWQNHKSAGSLMAANDEFFRGVISMNTTDLYKVIEDHPDSRIAPAAALMAADIHLQQGTFLRFQNKATANQELQQAVEWYGKTLASEHQGMLFDQALYGLARAKESLGELKPASKFYQQLVETNPDGVYGRLARQRLEDLKRPSIKEFYDKFADYDPKPAFHDLPNAPNQDTDIDFKNLPKEGPVYPLHDPLKLGPPAGEPKPGETAGEKKPEEAKSISPPPASETPAPTTPPSSNKKSTKDARD